MKEQDVHQLLLVQMPLLVDAVTGPFRYLPYLILPVVVAAALIALIVYRLRRHSKKSGG